MKKWYEELFENYAQKYDNESFTQGTLGECDFIEKEINFDKSLKILDIGCGTGRHSIELSKRGYAVTGIDLSDSLLAKAKEKAEEQQITVHFIKHDARKLPYKHEYDVVIMLCDGAFPLMETDEMNYEILKNATKSLKQHGKIIFTTLNGLFPLHHSIEKFFASNTKKDAATYRNNTFDLMTFRYYNVTEIEDDFGNKKELHCNERYYVPSEITWLLKSLGYKKIEIFGAKLGAFSMDDTLTTKDFEMLVVAKK
ncbi:MAG: class I SAM-dependent methyltransferase [Candidatus Thermoplasmatota archaeon]|nr:class I SAM-dependent methyltransferase [Candidatus Thermoplasmatota archaeon]